MGSIHDFDAAKKRDENLRADALELLDQIANGAQRMLALAAQAAGSPAARRDIDAIAALTAHAAGRVALLCDEKERLHAQYIRRLSEVLRERLDRHDDPLAVEALADSVERIAVSLRDRIRRSA